MARSAWSGIVSLGLINLPVKLLPLNSAEQSELIDKQQALFEQERARVQDNESLVLKKIRNAQYFLPPPRDAVVKLPEQHHVELTTMIARRDLDAVAIDNEYLVVPTEGSTHAFVLFVDAFHVDKRVEIGTIAMHSKKYLCALYADNEVMKLVTLQAPDKISSDPGFAKRHISRPLLHLMEQFESALHSGPKRAGRKRLSRAS